MNAIPKGMVTKLSGELERAISRAEGFADVIRTDTQDNIVADTAEALLRTLEAVRLIALRLESLERREDARTARDT